MTDSETQNGAQLPREATLELCSLRGPKSEKYTVQLGDDLLSLLSPDRRLIMMLPREEAARHIRFDWDLFRGRVASFVVVEGLKSHRFKCSRQAMKLLAAWLPQRPAAELERVVRHYGVSLVLVGALQLLFQSVFYWGWGLTLLLLGVACICFPKRPMYAVNAIILLAAGLQSLYASRPLQPMSWPPEEWAHLLATGLGAIMVIWSVQQYSLLSINHQLRAARGRGSPLFAWDVGPSLLVRKIKWGVTVITGVFLCQCGGLILQARFGMEPPHQQDWLVCVILGLLTAGVTAVLWARRRPTYLEAKVAGQFFVVLAVLYIAGAISSPLSHRLPFSPEVLWVGMYALSEPYVWVPVIGLVVFYNHWFTRSMEKEIEQGGE